MAKMYTEAQLYILQAKRRLKNNNYALFSKSRCGVFFVNNKLMTRDQLEDMKEKIVEIVKSEEFVSDPLNKLILDKDEFYSLDESGKFRYMLELSHVYAKLKQSIS